MQSLFKTSLAVAFLTAVSLINGEKAERAVTDAVDASTLEGKFLFGYQGFFRRPGQGNDHWTIKGLTPGPSTPGDGENSLLPLWSAIFATFHGVTLRHGICKPADISKSSLTCSQYPEECLFTTNFILPDGSNASLFESNCTGVVDTHFRWMQENSIDGILVQRFYGEFDDQSYLQLLDQIRTAAEKYGRTFAVEYDLSGVASADFTNVVSELLADYGTNIAPFMTSSAYLHHEGRPVLELWGLGVNKTKLNAADCATIFHVIRSANPNPYVLLGVQWAWASDATENPDYYDVYIQADVIQPWAVGAYGNDNYESFYNNTSVSDKALTDRLGIKYGPSVMPGGSDRNRRGLGEPLGNRYNGTFYEAQFKNMLDLKPFFVFGAMFDEFPESSQVIATLTAAEVPPAENPGFLGIDNGMDHDYYLQLAGRYAVLYHEI